MGLRPIHGLRRIGFRFIALADDHFYPITLKDLEMARYGKDEEPNRVLPRISQEVLAEMVGTTRSRVNLFMNKFRKLGFIEYNGGLRVNRSLLSVVLHD